MFIQKLTFMNKVDLGKYKLCTKWEDVTLEQWSRYIQLTAENKGKDIDILTTLEVFSDIPKEVIYQIPSDLFTKVIQKMKWLNEEPDIKPSNKIEYQGETYLINIMEKLKVKEYLDLNTIVENNKYDYPTIFALLCRKENEEYNEVFITEVFEDRIEMMKELPVTKALPLISFFLHLWNEYAQHSVNSLTVTELKSVLVEQVKNIRSSVRLMDYIIPSHRAQIMTLQKLEKSLMNI